MICGRQRFPRAFEQPVLRSHPAQNRDRGLAKARDKIVDLEWRITDPSRMKAVLVEPADACKRHREHEEYPILTAFDGGRTQEES